MKQLLFSLSLVTIVLLGCNSPQNNSSENNQEADNQPSIKYEAPKLLTFVQKNDNKLYDKLSAYVEFLNNITNFDAIKEAKKKRNNLIGDLAEILYKFEEENDIHENPEWNTIETELKQIGYSVTYAKGTINDLKPTAMLQDKIEKYAPEDYKLYLDIKNKYSETEKNDNGHKSSSRCFEVVAAYEKLQKKYPNSEYLDIAKPDFEFCLNAVTNIHRTKKLLLVYEFQTETYPTLIERTDIEPIEIKEAKLKTIIKKYPNSKYTPIIENIFQNISNFELIEAPIYAIVIDKFDNYEQAENKKFEYINNGKDIVHIIGHESEKYYYTCYRYYDDEKAAETALNKIKSDFPEANIIEYYIPFWEFKNY